jgi:tRNA(Arg) A34 adenosine deaminase TadA
MCTGTLYWANVGCLVYGYEEEKLLEITGNHAANPTMNLSSRIVLGHGLTAASITGAASRPGSPRQGAGAAAPAPAPGREPRRRHRRPA